MKFLSIFLVSIQFFITLQAFGVENNIKSSTNDNKLADSLKSEELKGNLSLEPARVEDKLEGTIRATGYIGGIETIVEANYSNGLRNGLEVIYKKGIKVSEKLFKEDELLSAKEYLYPSGELHYEYRYLDGERIYKATYGQTGIIELEYSDPISKEGTYEGYKNGVLRVKMQVGQDDKFSINYYDDNSKMVYELSSNLQGGYEKTYYEDGTIKSECLLDSNKKKNGIKKSYRKDGSLMQEEPYKDGELVGAVKKYDIDGHPIN